MRIDIITVLPELLRGFVEHSIVQRARKKGLVTVELHQLRDYAEGKRKNVDDYAYGGGGGMVLSCEPLARCLEKLTSARNYDAIIYLSPDGQVLNQPLANRLSLLQNIILICGHYKGIDERIRQKFVSMEVSIGDYVLSGGEPAAAVLSDALIRLIPGVLGDEESALGDSFQDGLLGYPVYTRPEEWRGMRVPDVLLGGDHKAISTWRHEQSLERTRARRPDLLWGDEGEE